MASATAVDRHLQSRANLTHTNFCQSSEALYQRTFCHTLDRVQVDPAREDLGTGSSPGSRTTSPGRPRIVEVPGATTARRNRAMAASRDRTTTGRRPMPGNSHHHTSP